MRKKEKQFHGRGAEFASYEREGQGSGSQKKMKLGENPENGASFGLRRPREKAKMRKRALSHHFGSGKSPLRISRENQ